EVENSGLSGFSLEAILAGLRADIDLASPRSVQAPQGADFGFGLGQRIELFIAQRQTGALDRLFADERIAERKYSERRRPGPSPVAARPHFTQDRQRRRVRDGAPFNHISVSLIEQRLEGQFPEPVVRDDEQAGFAAEQRLSRLEQEVIKFVSRNAD